LDKTRCKESNSKVSEILLLNIANEAGNGKVTVDEFGKKYAALIRQMRAAGIDIPLMIDAANWGRNEEYLLANAQYLLQQDPRHNLLFSWHIWDSGIARAVYNLLLTAPFN
jgi:mannan endo-1,4-beta-mannosidase